MLKFISLTALAVIISTSLTSNAYAHHFSYVGKELDAKLEHGKAPHIEFGSEPIYALFSDAEEHAFHRA